MNSSLQEKLKKLIKNELSPNEEEDIYWKIETEEEVYEFFKEVIREEEKKQGIKDFWEGIDCYEKMDTKIIFKKELFCSKNLKIINEEAWINPPSSFSLNNNFFLQISYNKKITKLLIEIFSPYEEIKEELKPVNIKYSLLASELKEHKFEKTLLPSQDNKHYGKIILDFSELSDVISKDIEIVLENEQFKLKLKHDILTSN